MTETTKQVDTTTHKVELPEVGPVAGPLSTSQDATGPTGPDGPVAPTGPMVWRRKNLVFAT